MERISTLIKCLLGGIYIIFNFLACVPAKNTFSLRLIDESTIATKALLDSTVVGGLSGIDWYNNKFLAICDDSTETLRYYELAVKFDEKKIKGIIPQKVFKFKDSLGRFLTSSKYDPEGIRFLNDSLILWSSEGNIKNKIPPSILLTNLKTQKTTEVPLRASEYEIKENWGARHNKSFEALSLSFDRKGVWIVTESPLKQDGALPSFTSRNAPVRIAYYSFEQKKITKQIGYYLETIAIKAKNNGIAVNGVVEMLAYEKDKLLIMERSYTSGYGNQGNNVKLFMIDHQKSQNIQHFSSLKNVNFKPAKKKQIFNFETIRSKIPSRQIDNLEGMCFGPLLSNGNSTLLFVADDNFNIYGPQLNQFLLFEILK